MLTTANTPIVVQYAGVCVRRGLLYRRGFLPAWHDIGVELMKFRT
jgi:hypothetical protein